VAFSPDGQHLVSIDSNRSAILWDLTRDQRGPAELEALVRCRVPYRLVDGVVVPATPDPAAGAGERRARSRLREVRVGIEKTVIGVAAAGIAAAEVTGRISALLHAAANTCERTTRKHLDGFSMECERALVIGHARRSRNR